MPSNWDFALSTSTNTTLAPSLEKRWPIASPIPRAPPTTTATWPANFMIAPFFDRQPTNEPSICGTPVQKKRATASAAALLKVQAEFFLGFDNFLPLVIDLFAQFGRGLSHRRELFHPFKRPARIDDCARVETFLARVDARIERTAPAAA